MLGYLIVCLLILSLSFALSLCFHRRIEESFPLSILSIIVIEYVMGCFCPTLTPGFYCSIAICLIGLVYILAYVFQISCFSKVKTYSKNISDSINSANDKSSSTNVNLSKKKEVWANFQDYICTPGLFFILLIMVWMYLINMQRQVAVWDELSHWALTVKNMCYFHKFGFISAANTTYKSYPPALSLWQYFVCRISGGYSDQAFYNGHSLLVMSLLLPFLKCFNWKRFPYALATFFFLAFLPLSITYTYMVVGYSDLSLAFLSFFLLFEYYTVERKSIFDYYLLSTGSIVLTLTKGSGFLFCCFVLAVVLFDSHRNTLTTIPATNNLSGFEKTWQKSKLGLSFWPSFLTILLSMLFAKFSWKLLLCIYHVVKDQVIGSDYGFSLHSFMLFLSGKGPSYWYETLSNYFIKIFREGYGKGLVAIPVVFWFALYMTLAYIISCRYPDKKRFRRSCWVLLVCGIVYLVGIFFTYIFTFEEYEAVSLASFKRYFYSFYFLFIYFILGVNFYKYETDSPFLLDEKKSQKWNKKFDWVWIPVALLWLLLVVPSEEFTAVTFDVSTDWSEERMTRYDYTRIHNYDSILDLETDKIALIAQQDVGQAYYTLKFEMAPLQFASVTSLGEAYYANDFFTTDLSKDEWVDYLRDEGCTYVYVYCYDDYFVNTYLDLFENPDDLGQNRLYRIEKNKDSIQLKYVEPTY